jgi:hypothetical protein
MAECHMIVRNQDLGDSGSGISRLPLVVYLLKCTMYLDQVTSCIKPVRILFRFQGDVRHDDGVPNLLNYGVLRTA